MEVDSEKKRNLAGENPDIIDVMSSIHLWKADDRGGSLFPNSQAAMQFYKRRWTLVTGAQDNGEIYAVRQIKLKAIVNFTRE